MQKRIIGIILLGISFITGVSNAGIISLPRYNPDMNLRSSNGGRDENSLNCSQKGMYDKPTDSCKVCIGESGGCCASISCNTSSECYQYSEVDASKYICSESCSDSNGTHYKTCKYRLTCADVNGLTAVAASPYISAGYSCSQKRTTCPITGISFSLGLCTESPIGVGGLTGGSIGGSLGGSIGGSLGGSIGGSLGGSIGGMIERQSVTCYTCTCPEGTTSTPEEGKECTVSHQVGNSKCYTCEENICPLGTYGEDCIPCPTGTYSNTVGASSCKGCPAGYKSKSGVTGATSMEAACEICPEGTYKTNIGPGSCTPCPTGYVAISGVTGATSMAQACTKACVACSTTTYPLLMCPSHAVCEECTPKNCEDNSTRYKISYCEEGYKQSGNSCIAKTCEELGYLSSIPEGMTCTPITTTAGRCYTNCSNQYSTCQEWLNATGHNAIVVTGSFDAIVKQGKYDEILYSSDNEISTTYNAPSLKHSVKIAPASIYQEASGGLCKSGAQSLYFEDFIAYDSTINIIGTKLRVGSNFESNGGTFNLSLSDDSSLEVSGNFLAENGNAKITGGTLIGAETDIVVSNDHSFVIDNNNIPEDLFKSISISGEHSEIKAKIVMADSIYIDGAGLDLSDLTSAYDITVKAPVACSGCGVTIGKTGNNTTIEDGIYISAPSDTSVTIMGNVSLGSGITTTSTSFEPEAYSHLNVRGTLNMNNNPLEINGGLGLSVTGKLLNLSSIKINLPPNSKYTTDYAPQYNIAEIYVPSGGSIKMNGVCRTMSSDFIRIYQLECSCTSVVPSCYCPGNMTVTSLSQMYNYASDSNGYPIKGTPLSSMGSSCSY